MTEKFSIWVKSTESSGGDNCVEVAFAEDGTVGVRHSKQPEGAVLEFAPGEYDAFVSGILQGELRRPSRF
jgi:hypothetical protein